ncbi:MAG: pilin [Gammaproteobacteria bacterium]|nr:pilin [Gammaproteobacteria bacterium]MDH5511991.1 pilin [Gammaproteobacteria bacterium]
MRSRVSEAASLSGAVRTAMDVAFSEGYNLGSIPVTPSTLNLSLSTSYKSKYVSRVGYNAFGVVTVTLQTEKSLGSAKSKTVIYSPSAQGGNLRWYVKGTVPTKYRPKN